MTNPEETLIYDALEVVYNVVEETDEYVTKVLRDLNLTRPQSDAVWVLDPGLLPITMGALAEKLRCEPPTATFIVEKLAEKGLVRRGSDAKDRRRTTVALTKAGVTARKRLTRAMMTGTPLAELQPEDLRIVVRLLEKAMAGRPKKYRM